MPDFALRDSLSHKKFSCVERLLQELDIVAGVLNEKHRNDGGSIRRDVFPLPCVVMYQVFPPGSFTAPSRSP